MDSSFGATAPYTVGVEEEFQLVDPGSRALSPAVDAVLAAGMARISSPRSSPRLVWK
jgi:gamma-glutamyl:cysteine ligase YbdK (ATP-grasp superfamily)